MMIVLPSYVVEFRLDSASDLVAWRVTTDEGLESFCRVLRLNGIGNYVVRAERAEEQR